MSNCIPRVTTDSKIHTIPIGPWTVPVLSKVKETVFAFNSALTPIFNDTHIYSDTSLPKQTHNGGWGWRRIQEIR